MNISNMPEVTESMQQQFSLQEIEALRLRSSTTKERIKRLRKLEKWLLDHRQEIHRALYADFKKPAEEVDISEILPVLSEIRYVCRHLKKWMRPEATGTPMLFTGTRLEIRHEPKGVCLIIAPWNYPLNLQLMPLVSCLAAGNTAILKPSELSSHTTSLLVQLVAEVFPPEIVSIFTGEKEIAQALLSLPFNHIFFTGSPAVGKQVMAAAAKQLASVTLELGGKSPAIVLDKVNLQDAAEKIAWGKWTNTGQTCVAPDYVLVHESQQEAFTKALQEACHRLFKSDAASMQESAAYGRIISDRHFRRFEEMLKDAQAHGSRLVFGGEMDARDNYMAPTVVAGGADEATIWQEEIFGPLLPIRSYRDLQEVVSYINARPKPLALYVFGNRKVAANFILQQTSAGSVCINDCVLQYSHPKLPFGGVNNSGIGKGHGYEGFREFSNAKGVLSQRIGLTSTKMVYPPYTKRVRKFIDLLIRHF